MSEEHDIGAADEQALREMFAALVADAAPSQQSPLEVQRLARAERQSQVDSRGRRLRYTRNALVAAVLIGIVAWVAPRFVTSDSSTATASSSSSSAASTAPAGTFAADGGAAAAPQSRGDRSSAAAASAPAGPAAGEGGSVTSASSAGSSAPASAAGSSGAMSSGPASSAAAPAATSAAAASSASSSAASSGGASGAPVACVPVPAGALNRVRAALPGYRGTVRITSCTSGTSAGSVAGTTTFVLAGRAASTCTGTTPCPPVPSTPIGSPLPGTKDAYAFRDGVLVVGADGVRVTVSTTPGGPSRTALIAAARALLGSLG